MTIASLVIAVALLVFAYWIATKAPEPWKTPFVVIVIVIALIVVLNLVFPGVLSHRVG